MNEPIPAAEQLEGHLAGLRQLLDGLVPSDVPLSHAAALWNGFDAVVRLGEAGKTLLAGRVEETEQWRREGYRSAAEHMARRSGQSVGLARRLLATSKHLTGLPVVETALRRGELSAAQAEVIADAATADPAAESRLVELAGRTSVAELRVECARTRAAADPDPEGRHRRIHRQRRLRQGTDPDGAWWFSGRGTIDAGAGFNTVLEPIIDDLFDQARREGRRVTRETLAFDALMELARQLWDHEHICPLDDDTDAAADEEGQPVGGPSTTGPPPLTDEDEQTASPAAQDESAGHDPDPRGDARVGNSDSPRQRPEGTDHARNDERQLGVESSDRARTEAGDIGPSGDGSRADVSDATSTGSASRTPRRKGRRRRSRRNPRYMALLRVDLEALVRGAVEGQETCEIAGLGPVPVATARSLLGDAVLRLVITRGVDVANTTYLGRGPNAAQRIALLWSSPTCVVEGCIARRVQHDHRVPWAASKQTRLDNLDDYCEHHHQLKTRFGWALEEGTGKRRMVPPTDPGHPHHTRRSPQAA